MTLPRSCSRRSALGLLAAGTASLALPSQGFAQIGSLDLFGPPAGPSIILAHAVATGGFSGISKTVTFNSWRSPDELRAGLTSGTMGLSVVPVQAAANLYNRGFPIKLANIMTNGLLYILAGDASITAIPDLAGRHIAVPYRGDTPEIIFARLLAHHGLSESDLTISYAASPIGALQMLLAGRVDAALTAEPAKSAGILRGKKAGKTDWGVISMQEAWGDMTGGSPVLPQAGLAVTQAFLEANGDQMDAILDVLETAAKEVLNNPIIAAQTVSPSLGMPAPLLAAAIPGVNLCARPAQEARADIERMLTGMAGENLTRIGGGLPDDGFYL